MGIITTTNNLLKVLVNMQKLILLVTSGLLVLGISLQVILRYILEIDLYGMGDVIIILAFWLYFIGGAQGSYEKSHISADIISTYIKNEKVKLVHEVILQFITTAICLLVTYWSIDYLLFGIQEGAKSTSLRIPLVIPQSAIFVGFCLMSLYLIYYLIGDIKRMMSKNKLKEERKRI